MIKKITLISLCVTIYFAAYANSDFAVLSGKLDFLHDGDSIILTTMKYDNGSRSLPFVKELVCRVKNKSFQFRIPIQNYPLYFDLTFLHSDRRVRGSYFLEAGDNIVIDEMDKVGYVHFVGKGSGKLNLLYRLNEISSYYLRSTGGGPRSAEQLVPYFHMQDSSVVYQMEYLDSRKKAISTDAYDLLKINIFTQAISKYEQIGGRHGGIRGAEVVAALEKFKEYKDGLQSKYNILYRTTNRMLQFSLAGKSIQAKYVFDSCILMNRPFVVNNYYDYIRANFKDTFRDHLIFNIIYDFKDFPGIDLNYCINDALAYVKNKDFIPILENIKRYRITGTEAYNFSLPDINGSFHNLSDFTGKVVLLDFYTKYCGNCIEVAPYLAKIEKSFVGQEVVFISINCDKEKNQWLYCINSGKYSSADALNLSTYGKGESHPVILNYNVNSYPTLVLIDKRGKLMENPLDPRHDNGKSLIDEINKALNM